MDKTALLNSSFVGNMAEICHALYSGCVPPTPYEVEDCGAMDRTFSVIAKYALPDVMADAEQAILDECSEWHRTGFVNGFKYCLWLCSNEIDLEAPDGGDPELLQG